jgi:hypothetical protein
LVRWWSDDNGSRQTPGRNVLSTDSTGRRNEFWCKNTITRFSNPLSRLPLAIVL